MTKSILLYFLVFFSLQSNAQTSYENSIFGFTMEIPENWTFYGSTEFDKSINGCQYIFFLPQTTNRLSEWDHRLRFSATGNGYANSLEDVHLFEYQRLHRKFDEIKVIEETSNSLLTQVLINNVSYNILTLVNYQNGISYIASYSYQSNEENIDTSSIKLFFNEISYSSPSVDYDDIISEISKTPENATLYYKKAQRAFGFHDFETGIKDVNQALDLFSFYGEAYYLRAYLHLAIGDTIEACRDFHSANSNDYFTDFELDEYCNTRKIAKALEEESSLFKDFDTSANHLAYIDSIKMHEYIFLSIDGKPNEKVLTYMDHLNHLFMLEFAQLDSIYKAETGILQLFSFGIICKKYPEQITDEQKQILKSKEDILVLESNQKTTHLMPVKEIAEMMYGIVKAIEKEREMQSRTEFEVKKLITNYSKFPDSYEPLSFEQFHIMYIADGNTLKKEKNSDVYVIGHRYRIKDIHGDIVECFNTFKFVQNFNINIIEGEESNTSSAYPPMIQDWLEKYGRMLSDKEKNELGIL